VCAHLIGLALPRVDTKAGGGALHTHTHTHTRTHTHARTQSVSGASVDLRATIFHQSTPHHRNEILVIDRHVVLSADQGPVQQQLHTKAHRHTDRQTDRQTDRSGTHLLHQFALSGCRRLLSGFLKNNACASSHTYKHKDIHAPGRRPLSSFRDAFVWLRRGCHALGAAGAVHACSVCFGGAGCGRVSIRSRAGIGERTPS
jgi:hypothetical protein